MALKKVIDTILGLSDYIEYLRGKSATLLLSLSTTKTIEIEGLTQAGIPGLIDLTPTLDSEFVCIGEVKSLTNMAKTPKGVPTPALITRAVHMLKPFKEIELLDLGMSQKPQLDYIKIHDFELSPSASIITGANINALEVFEKGVKFGKNYVCGNDYIILGESVPSGTTTAYALARALGYECFGKFSSSFKKQPLSIKENTVKKALENIKDKEGIFEKIGEVADNMLIFNAGFILGNSYSKTKLILAGGTQMAAVLLLVNSIINYMEEDFDSSNLALCTTKWVKEDKSSDIKYLLELLNFPINAYSANFDFATSKHAALKLYDDGEAKEGVGAGGALCYGLINGLSSGQIIEQVEKLLE